MSLGFVRFDVMELKLVLHEAETLPLVNPPCETPDSVSVGANLSIVNV